MANATSLVTGGAIPLIVDGSGNPVVDKIGLINVITSLGLTDIGSVSYGPSTTFAGMTGSDINFTLARSCNLVALFLSTGYLTSTGASNVGLIRCNLDSGTVSGNLNFGTSNIITLMGWRYFAGVSAGSHNIHMEIATAAGGTSAFNTTETALQLFQLGS